jgi:hypothetical protein
MPDEPAVCLLVEFEDQSKKACMRLTNISLIRNSGRAYLAASGEGKHRLDEEFRKSKECKHQLDEEFMKSVPGSERRRQTSPWWGIQEERTWQWAEKVNIGSMRNSGRAKNANISLMKNSGRAYLAASREGKHCLDEEFRKNVPGSERRKQTSAWWRIQEEHTWQWAEKANIALMKNSGRVYLAASGESKHRLDEEFRKSIPGSERRKQTSAWWRIQEEYTWQRAEKANIALMKNSGRAYLAVSGEGKHQLDEEFRKTISGSERRRQTSPWWGIHEECTWQRAEKANISLMKNSGRAYLAASGEGKHRLDEEFRKSVPGSERRKQTSAWWGIQE